MHDNIDGKMQQVITNNEAFNQSLSRNRVTIKQNGLKGLSHEIDFKKIWQKFTDLDLIKGRGWFLNFLGAPMILYC